MFWTNLAIVAFIAWQAAVGRVRGLILVAADLAGVVLAVALAIFTHHQVAGALLTRYNTVPSFADILAFAVITGVTELGLMVASRQLLNRLPHQVLNAAWNNWGGGVLNSLKATLWAAIGLIIFAGLPLSAATKRPVTDAELSQLLLRNSGRLQTEVNRVVGSTIQDTFNFFTVKPESEESITLGFKTTKVKIDAFAEEQMLNFVNRERTSRGLSPLKMNDTARAVARTHSRDMFARGYFSHVNPEGQDPFDRMEAGRVRFASAGENLALAPTLDLAHNGLMNSPGHRQNILSPDFKTVGIGIMDGGVYGLMVTQNFTD